MLAAFSFACFQKIKIDSTKGAYYDIMSVSEGNMLAYSTNGE